MRTWKRWIAVIVGVVLIIAVGLGIQQTFASPAENLISIEEISSRVTDKYPGTVTEVELDKEKGKHVYEVELIGEQGEYEVKLDALSGDVLKVKKKEAVAREENTNLEKEADQSQTVNESPAASTKISAEEAAKIALEKVPGTIKEIELDHDDGLLVYEIDIRTETGEAELEINAYTGEIVFLSIETKKN